MNWIQKRLPRPTHDELAERAIEYLVSTGVARGSIRHDRENFRLVIANGATHFLHNLYDFYCRAWPWQRRRTIEGFFAFRNDPNLERPKAFEDVRPILLPGVRDAFMFETLRLQAILDGEDRNLSYPTLPLGSRLRVCLLLDYPNSTSMVNGGDLAGWGVSFDEAFGAALKNLEPKSAGAEFQQVVEGVYLSPWADCHDTARLLLPRTFANLGIDGAPVVTAPNWNRLFVGGDADLASLAGVISGGMNVLREEPRPMSGLPLVRREGQWMDLDLPRGHAVEPLLRKSRVTEMHGVYESQKSMLEQIHEKQGVDIYVAAFNGTVNEETDEYSSYAMWAKGCVSLTPRAERISFFDDDQANDKVVATVDWDIVAQHCAALMRESEHTPTRYLLEVFPSAHQLDLMSRAQAARDSAGV